MLLPQRQCHRCTAAQKKQWGCESDTPLPMRFDGEETRRCPLRPYLERPHFYTEILKRFRLFRRGILPEAAEYKANPDKLLELFDVVETALHDAEGEKEERNKRQEQIVAQANAAMKGAGKTQRPVRRNPGKGGLKPRPRPFRRRR